MTEQREGRGRRRAILFDVEEEAQAPPRGAVRLEGQEAAVDPASAPPVPDDDTPPPAAGRAMQTVAVLAARRQGGLARWFLGALAAVIGFLVSVAMWDFVAGLLLRSPVLGWVALGLVGLLLAICIAIALRELVALWRLGRIDDLRREALLVSDLQGARRLAEHLRRFYAGRADTRWGREELAARSGDVFDADAMIALAERSLLAPLDAAATREVEAAARQVALVTAVVPLALADVVAALASNLRMIRRIALIYGGRGGTVGSWRLARSVLTHLAATGAVAVGDDMIQSVAGGGVLARLSRRFGEGLVNGALTARVGVAAMEVCRPLPFTHERPPRITAVIQRSLTGLFTPKEP